LFNKNEEVLLGRSKRNAYYFVGASVPLVLTNIIIGTITHRLVLKYVVLLIGKFRESW